MQDGRRRPSYGTMYDGRRRPSYGTLYDGRRRPSNQQCESLHQAMRKRIKLRLTGDENFPEILPPRPHPTLSHLCPHLRSESTQCTEG